MTQGSLLDVPRLSYTDAVVALFTDRPGEWFDGLTLAKVGGCYAWRTRTSEARRRLQAAGLGTIENTIITRHDGVRASLYRFVPAGEGT